MPLLRGRLVIGQSTTADDCSARRSKTFVIRSCGIADRESHDRDFLWERRDKQGCGLCGRCERRNDVDTFGQLTSRAAKASDTGRGDQKQTLPSDSV